MINVKAETFSDPEKKSYKYFRSLLREQRCVIPASGFYEWKKVKGESNLPYYIHLKSRVMYGFAGIYSIWKDPEGVELQSFAIITTTPNKVVSEIHNRMPVILTLEAQDYWSNSDNAEEEKLTELLVPYPNDEMIAEETTKAINKVSHKTN